MKLLYVCGTYAPNAFAGSEISAHELLRELNRDHSITVLVATDQKYTGGLPGKTEFDGIPIQGIGHRKRRESIDRVIEEFSPDVILTQLLWSDVAIAAGQETDSPLLKIIPRDQVPLTRKPP